MPSAPDPLDHLLDQWGKTPEPPPNLAPEVWRRLATAERRTEAPGWRARIEVVFSRPSFATTFVIACVLFGLFLAEVRVSRLEAERNAQLAQNYLRLVDPLIGQATTGQLKSGS
jgi:hypothetical protein